MLKELKKKHFAIPKEQKARLQEFGELERVTGIEPAWPVWKTGTLPLSYTRKTARSLMGAGRLSIEARRASTPQAHLISWKTRWQGVEHKK